MKNPIFCKFLFVVLLLVGCSRGNPKRIIEHTYVDSVWIKGSGEINTLQFDPIYFFRTSNGGIHQSRKKVRVGDSCILIFTTAKQ
jgi:hypothetical protein